MRDLNSRPSRCKRAALPTELIAQYRKYIKIRRFFNRTWKNRSRVAKYYVFVCGPRVAKYNCSLRSNSTKCARPQLDALSCLSTLVSGLRFLQSKQETDVRKHVSFLFCAPGRNRTRIQSLEVSCSIH